MYAEMKHSMVSFDGMMYGEEEEKDKMVDAVRLQGSTMVFMKH